jgi:peptidoglycan/xylan/chitin deacetylase (PgdA/CDA1 family)
MPEPRVRGRWLHAALKKVAAALVPSGAASTPIVAYHSVHPDHPLAVKPELFRVQIEWLASNFRVVRLCEYLKNKRAGTLAPGTAVVTFDDGYRDNYTHAYPVLKDLQCPATLFVATRFLCAADRATGTDLGLFPGLEPLTWGQLLEMGELVEVGAHTHSHVQVSRITPRVLKRELLRNLETIYRHLRQVPRFFSYPWGQHRDVSAAGEALLQRFFDAAVTAVFGADNRPERINPFRLRRVMVGPGDDLALFAAKVSGGFDRIAALRGVSGLLASTHERRNCEIHV